MIRNILILTGGGMAALIALIALVAGSGVLPAFAMSWHGWLAFLGGALLCFLLSGGLFALAFFSARTGRDDITDLSRD